jgi:ABC-type transport system involved in multi-copper enzyme maturation permease subunit
MLPGPVFNIELLTTARRARYYAIRLGYGLLLLFFIWQNAPWHYTRPSRWNGGQMSIQEMAVFSAATFRNFVYIQAAAILFLTPALVAGVVAEEKQRKTLHYLLASRLTSREIILGKLGARLLHVMTFLTIGLPVMSLLSLFGGVDPQMVAISFAAMLSTTLFIASMSILISTYSRRPREAISMAYVLELAWFFLPTILPYLMRSLPFWAKVYRWIGPVNDWIAASSPFFLVTPQVASAPGAAFFGALFWMIGLQLVAATLFVALAVAWLRPIYRKEGEGSRWFARWSRGRRLLPRPDCGDDAMLWKERYVSRTSAVTKLVGGLIGLAIFGLLVYSMVELAVPAFEELNVSGYGSTGPAQRELSGYLRGFTTLIYVGWALALASAASSAVVQEREADTWTSLVSAPLSGLEIVRAKMIGAFWGLRWVGLIQLALWLTGLAAGSVHPFGFVAVVTETTVFLWFVTALGTLISVRAKSSARAMTATMAILIVLNGGYLMCCIPLQPNTNLVAAGVTPFITAVSLVTYEEFGRLLNMQYPGPGWDYYDTFVTCFMGICAYAVAACVLTLATIHRFDDWIGRPRWDWDERAHGAFSKPEPDEEVPS